MKKFYRKKWFWIILIVVVIISAVMILHKQSDQTMSDDQGVMPADDSVQTNQYYSGVVQAQDTISLQKDDNRTVKDIFVSAGDSVIKGQKLFGYDTADIQSSLDQADLELSSAGTDIADYQNQIADLNNRKKASLDASERSDYDDQISDLTMQIRQSQLTQKTKQLEINTLNQKITDSTVTSPIDGVIRDVNLNQSDNSAFMTILSAGAWQIEGTVDEMNLSSLSQNMNVIIHSRVSDDTWNGTISRIDTEPVKSNTDMDDTSSGEASRYHFYVTPDTSDGLLLGQHVYIEISSDTGDEAS